MSHPRKVLLLLCADYKARTVLSFVLTNRGYRVIDDSALARDLVLCVDNDRTQQPIHLAFSAITGVPTLMVHQTMATCELLDLIKNALVKKRGPKTAAQMLREQVSA